MDYKRLFRTMVQLLGHPAKKWLHVLHGGSKSVMLGEFLVPLIILCGTALFLGRVINNGLGWDSLSTAMISAALRSISMFLAYYISAYLIVLFTSKYTSGDYPRDMLDTFTGYSMAVVLGLDICLGLFPEVRILAFIAQFYTLKVVWDGAAVLLKIAEERRLAYTIVVSAIIMLMPVIVGRIIGVLSVVLR